MKVEKKSKTLNVKERKNLYGMYVKIRNLKQFNPINKPPMSFEAFLEKYAEKDFFKQVNKQVNDIYYKRVNNVLKGV
tara:strand:+ start:574 stop:804 length:231 start_codon:yes stop_codon:yes gene_type:complete